MRNNQIVIFAWVQHVIDIIAFVPFFVDTDYSEVVLQWLSVEPNEPIISIKAWRESLDLIHNLARHESGAKTLNQLEAISILKIWKEQYLSEPTLSNDENYEDLRVLYYMSYASLLESALLKRQDITDIRHALDHILDRAIKAFQSPSLRYGSYNVPEFWTALAKFAVNNESTTVPQKSNLECNDTVLPVLSSPPMVSVLPSPLPDPIPLFAPAFLVVTGSSPISTSKKPIEQWTSEEVQQWLGLPSSVLQLSCDRALLVYAQLILNTDAQSDEYERNLRPCGLTREQLANLIASLTTLYILHTTETSFKSPPEQWSNEQVKCWFEQNNLSNYLLDTFAFVDGMELVIYAKMIIISPARIDSEYDRLQTRIQIRYNGKDLLQLDEYARLVRALKKNARTITTII
ncbi:unnamed protein product [Rotaria sp. Silwood1]|nr:unnamed protein product [Rotaria sp. Silwood1]